MREIRVNPEAKNPRPPAPAPEDPSGTCETCGGPIRLLNEASDTPRCGCGLVPAACTCRSTTGS